jgi:hypothetical protein
MRRYDLSSNNVLDALLLDADGRLLNRSTMGDDLFWAIRGGGGESFAVVLSWKLRLVHVLETVSVLTVRQSRNQSASDLITKWQMARNLVGAATGPHPPSHPAEPASTVAALFLCHCSGLLCLIGARFPELGVTRPDYEEISWIQSTVYFAFHSSSKPLELLLDRTCVLCALS